MSDYSFMKVSVNCTSFELELKTLISPPEIMESQVRKLDAFRKFTLLIKSLSLVNISTVYTDLS